METTNTEVRSLEVASEEDVKDKPIIKIRENWIDGVKFFLIVFIVFGHTVLGPNIFKEYIYIFHVPGFVIISGFWINKDEKILTFIKKRLLKVYVPYLIVGVISILIFAILGKFAQNQLGGDYETNILENLKGLLYGNPLYNMKYNLPLWYLPFIFVTEIIAMLIIKLLNKFNLKRVYYVFVSLFFFIVAGLYYYFVHFHKLPFGLENVIYLIGFLFLGYSLKDFIKVIRNLKTYIRVIIVAVFISLSFLIFYFNRNVNYTNSNYGNFPLFLCGAVLINWAIMVILPNKLPMFLINIGKKTMIIMLLHKFPILLFQVIVPVFKTALKDNNLLINTMSAIFVSIITIILCVLFDFVLVKLISKSKILKPKKKI